MGSAQQLCCVCVLRCWHVCLCHTVVLCSTSVTLQYCAACLSVSHCSMVLHVCVTLQYCVACLCHTAVLCCILYHTAVLCCTSVSHSSTVLHVCVTLQYCVACLCHTAVLCCTSVSHSSTVLRVCVTQQYCSGLPQQLPSLTWPVSSLSSLWFSSAGASLKGGENQEYTVAVNRDPQPLRCGQKRQGHQHVSRTRPLAQWRKQYVFVVCC